MKFYKGTEGSGFRFDDHNDNEGEDDINDEGKGDFSDDDHDDYIMIKGGSMANFTVLN